VSLPPRNDDGSFPAFAWPGGYPIRYYTRDGLCVCAACAASDTSDPATDADVYWEGPAEACDDCGTMIESAYGDPEAKS
jgi:hypothetical protein